MRICSVSNHNLSLLACSALFMFVELGFSENEKLNWRQLVEHTDINHIIAGSIDQLEALQPGLAKADLSKDLGKYIRS